MVTLTPGRMAGMTPHPMTHEVFAAFVATSRWKFAKTMAHIPHEYTLRKNAASDALFAEAVQFIRDHGYSGWFGRTEYRYYDVDGWKYWTMGFPVPETILINRAQK